MNQRKYGIKTEKEHLGTFHYIINKCKQGKCPKDIDILNKVVSDHMRERKDYYKLIKKYKL